MWKSVAAAPADSILGLTEAFNNDPNPNKVNLGAGVYKDDRGITPVLDCVKDAERILLGTERSKSYLPITGDPLYTACVQRLIFGEKQRGHQLIEGPPPLMHPVGPARCASAPS